MLRSKTASRFTPLPPTSCTKLTTLAFHLQAPSTTTSKGLIRRDRQPSPISDVAASPSRPGRGRIVSPRQSPIAWRSTRLLLRPTLRTTACPLMLTWRRLPARLGMSTETAKARLSAHKKPTEPPSRRDSLNHPTPLLRSGDRPAKRPSPPFSSNRRQKTRATRRMALSMPWPNCRHLAP